MNTVVLMGRLTRKPDVRWTTGANPQAVARYTLAVDRRFKKEGQQNADFISCVVFGKGAEFADKYLMQGTKITIRGKIRTSSYTNRDGNKVYTTDVVVEEQDFAESMGSRTNSQDNQRSDQFMDIPDGIEEQLPFLS